jgi:hypothetical protein
MTSQYIPKKIVEGDLSHLYKDKSKINGAGEGVYSKIYIPKNTIVEKANVLPVPSNNVEKTELMDYVFNNPYKNGEFFVAFGFGSLYNHSDDPHMIYSYCPEQNKMIFTSIKEINPNEEIYISYGPNWWQSRKNKIKEEIGDVKLEEMNLSKNVATNTKKYRIKKY